eukprot:1157003-Pelagomonas_calceolata.AAC.5
MHLLPAGHRISLSLASHPPSPSSPENAAPCRPPLTLSMLASLAREGRFGRALPPHEQVFVVVADSVWKQLDGLKLAAAAAPAAHALHAQDFKGGHAHLSQRA